MYEAKYRKYITKNQSRFAEESEILQGLSAVTKGCKASGVPLYYNGSKLYVENSDQHSITIGATGSKKTRTVVFSTVKSIISAKESALINDPKGEIYNRTAGYAKSSGAEVYVLNFRDPNRSHGWNPFFEASKLYHSGKVVEATQCINDFTDAVFSQSSIQTTDRYWVDCAKSFLNSLILLLVGSIPAEYCNIRNLIPMCYECHADALASILEDMDQTSSAAVGLHTVLDLDAERTKSCIYSTLLSNMGVYTQNIGLQKMMSRNSFDISDIGKKQTIVYVVYPDEKNSLASLVCAFFLQCYQTLISAAAETSENKLNIRVNFVLDEFSNLPPLNGFENQISEARSRNIRYFLFIQSFSQLVEKYNQTAETILSNCANWLCFSSRDTTFNDRISKVCGREIDYNGIEHDLVSPFTMQHLIKADEYAEVLIIRQGKYPYVAQLPDIDYISLFKNRNNKKEQMPITEPIHSVNEISFSEWASGIRSGKFDFPFPKSKYSSKKSCEFDLQDELNAKFKELFGA